MSELSISAVRDLPELREGDDLAALIADRATLEDGDVVVVAQKAISKIEGRIVRLGDKDKLDVILGEAKRVVRTRGSLVIAETRHGFICASAESTPRTRPSRGRSCSSPSTRTRPRRLRERLKERTGRDVGVIVSDSFGRPWRQGTTDVAIGATGRGAARPQRRARPERL